MMLRSGVRAARLKLVSAAIAAIFATGTATAETIQAGELYPTGQPILELIRTQDAHAGSLIRAAYGEPFWTAETMAVDDITRLGVASL